METTSEDCVKSISAEDNSVGQHRNTKTGVSNDDRVGARYVEWKGYNRRVLPPYVRINGSVHKDTTKLALNVVSGAAYGHPSDWNQLEEVPAGHELSYVDSIRSVVDHLLVYFIFPKAFLNIPLRWFREAKIAHEEFGKYLYSLLEDYKRDENHVGGGSALKALVENSVEAGGSGSKVGTSILSDEELAGNAFIILLGGHESTYYRHF